MTGFMFSPEQVRVIKEMRDGGSSVRDIMAVFNCSDQSVRRALDSAKREQDGRRYRHKSGKDNIKAGEGTGHRVKPADVAARIAEIPADRRSLTAAAFGDPIPNDPRRHWCPWLNRGTA